MMPLERERFESLKVIKKNILRHTHAETCPCDFADGSLEILNEAGKLQFLSLEPQSFLKLKVTKILSGNR